MVQFARPMSGLLGLYWTRPFLRLLICVTTTKHDDLEKQPRPIYKWNVSPKPSLLRSENGNELILG